MTRHSCSVTSGGVYTAGSAGNTLDNVDNAISGVGHIGAGTALALINEAGVGVRGLVDGREITVGRRGGRIEAGWDGIPRATFIVRDTVKPSSADAIRAWESISSSSR